ncbi:hypothetical protein [Nostoc flagelliforme]|uniref:hypothetical protein n=1 Tax=Nostoc flagelliforme TaxID=1306274 RepID=UPI001F55A233|nr:hypothetical protein [Nostoc flagelliforme]
MLVLQERQQLIELWVRKQQQASADITLLCSLKNQGFLPQVYRRAGGDQAMATRIVGWGSSNS